MVSYTTNKRIEKPANNADIDTWDVNVNADFDIIDKAFGSVTSISVTSVTATPVVLTYTQYIPLAFSFSGTLTANVTYQFPSGVGGQWLVRNTATGAFTLTIASLGAGTSVAIPSGATYLIWCDGTNVVFPIAGGNTTGSFNLATLAVVSGTPGTSYNATGALPATNGGTGITNPVTTSSIEFIIDGGGTTISTGIKGDLEIPFACTITEWTILADQTGSIQLDIWKTSYAGYPPTVANTITAAAKPVISAALNAQSSTLTAWTTAVALGDIMRFNVDSVTACQRVTLSLRVTRT